MYAAVATVISYSRNIAALRKPRRNVEFGRSFNHGRQRALQSDRGGDIADLCIVIVTVLHLDSVTRIPDAMVTSEVEH